MSKYKIGIGFCWLGTGLFLAAVGLDSVRGKPLNFGPLQWGLTLLSLIILCAGFLFLDEPAREKILKNSQTSPHVRFLLTVLFILVLILLLINPIRFIANYLVYPYPFEYRDAAGIATAFDFSKGINPYSLENFPDHMYVYGFLYPLLISPFVKEAAHPILIAKLLDVFFLVLFLCLSYLIFRKQKASRRSSILGLLILLNSTCLIWKINGARPDLPGLFFALLGLYVLLIGKPNVTRLLVCALACGISFYFKQYLVFSALIIGLYLFFYVSRKKALLFIIGGLSLGILSFLLVQKFLPLYFEYAIVHHITVTGHDFNQMEMQTKDFFHYYWVLCFLYVYYLYTKITALNFRDFKEMRFEPLALKDPLIQGNAGDLFNLGVVGSILILTFSLGKHTGNTYTYYGELLLPFLLYLLIPKLDEWFQALIPRLAVYFFILFFCIFQFQPAYQTDFTDYRQSFVQLYHAAAQCTNIYDSTPLITLYKVEHGLVPLYNNGQSQYSPTAIPIRASLLSRFSQVSIDTMDQQLQDWRDDIAYQISHQQFDCIFTDSDQGFEKYRVAAQFDPVLEWKVTLWVPDSPISEE